MDMMRAGFKFFRVAAEEDCPLSPDGARRLCDAVAQMRVELFRIKMLLVYAAAVITVSNGGDLLSIVFKAIVP